MWVQACNSGAFALRVNIVGSFTTSLYCNGWIHRNRLNNCNKHTGLIWSDQKANEAVPAPSEGGERCTWSPVRGRGTDASLRRGPSCPRDGFSKTNPTSLTCALKIKTLAHGTQTWFLETQAFFIFSPKWLTRAFIFWGVVGPKRRLTSFVKQVGSFTSKKNGKRKGMSFSSRRLVF